MIKVAIVLLNWNGKKYLEKFLPSIVKHSNKEGYKIFLVDNGSDDDSLPWTTEHFSDIELIKFHKNYGFALGYAKALQQIESEYYILLNSDVEVSDNWISPIIEFMDREKSIAACMPKIKSYKNKEFFEYAGASGGFIDKFGYPFCRGRILNVIEKDTGQYDDIKEIFWASGACMFVRSSSYFEAGGLDGDFFAHMDEIDLCWRFKRLGFKIFCFPDVSIYHVGGGTLPNNTPRKIFLNYRNNLFLLFKNLPSNFFIRYLFVRLALDGISALLYLGNLKFRFSWSVLKAHAAFYFCLPKLISKRKRFKKKEKFTVIPEILTSSILMQFFLKKKKYYSQLNK